MQSARVAFCLLVGVLAASSAFADFEVPNRKAGLWEIKMVMAGGQMPPQIIQQCTDETTDKDMRTTFNPMTKEMCSKQDVQKTPTGMTMDSVCNINGSNTTSHIDINGDFDSAYTMQMSSTHEGGPAYMPKQSNITMEAKWLGACKPDQRAGDIIMQGGLKMNVKDLKALQGMMPGAPKH